MVTQTLVLYHQQLSLEEARKHIYAVDSKSLIIADRTGLQEHKKCKQHPPFLCPYHPNIYTVFARTDYDGAPLTNLIDIVNYVKPTAFLGFSTINVNSILTLHDYKITLVLQYTFDEEVASAMVSLNKRPIIFPLSNPVLLCEVDYDVTIKWTNSKVVYPSGSPNQKIE